jgi:uroporphyrin-III C-methyltransferase
LPQADTLAIYMGRRQAAGIAQSLLAQGRPADWPVCVVESVSTTQERRLFITLDALAQGAASHWLSTDAPALLLLGAVFGNREQHASVLADGRLRA